MAPRFFGVTHSGLLNEDSDVCDAHDWDKDDEDIECSPVELFMRFDRYPSVTEEP